MTRTQGRIVGHKYNGDTNKIFQRVLEDDVYPISNNIGIGILSYNRLGSVQRLIASIRKHTNLTATTVFVSDESSLPEVKEWLSQQQDIICIFNDRIGVAGNSNRLLRCLSRFKYKLLLNDDVEIMSKGWDSFYFSAMEKTKYHHFCFKQIGVYGATTAGEMRADKDGIIIKTVQEKPQGAIMAFDHLAFSTVGYFDERFGTYGFEHVDWSRRVSQSEIQKAGYHDVVGSEKYFRIWNEESAVENRIANFNKNRAVFTTLSAEERRIFVDASDATVVPSVSVIIPCRDAKGSRSSSIPTVINNIKAQRFPNIDITIAEQDDVRYVAESAVYPCRHILIKSNNQPFCKAAAFNAGVSRSKHDVLILHDADITVPGWYIHKINKIMRDHESCHIGQQVLYLTAPSTLEVNKQHVINKEKKCDHIVDYFEGGSLAIKKDAYIKIGGFDEQFVGYGVEDCEFFQRLSKMTKSFNERSVKMVHLWHDRTPGWEERHKINKAYLEHIQNKYSIVDRCNQLRDLLKKRYSL